MGMLLRHPYEVRDAAEYFDDIQDVKITKDMLDLAKHIVETKAGHFEPAKFQDHYESALQELLEKKQKGQPIAAAKKATPSNVYNLMDALRANIKGGQPTAAEKPLNAPVSAVANPELEACRSTGLIALRERDPSIKDVTLDFDGMTVAKANTKVEDTPIKTIVIGDTYLEKGKKYTANVSVPDRREGASHVLY
jgi:hypothetical protein